MSASTLAGVKPDSNASAYVNGFSADPGCRGATGALDRSTVGGIAVITRAFPRQPLSPGVVEHDHRDVGCAVPIQSGPMTANDSADLALQFGIERGHNPRRLRIGSGCEHHLDEMGREKGRRRVREAELLDAGVVGLRCCQRTGVLHTTKNTALSREGGVQLAERVVTRRPARKTGQERRLRRREHRWIATEVRVAGAAGADDLVAVTGEIQIEREDFRFVETMLEAQRENGFANLLDRPTNPPW